MTDVLFNEMVLSLPVDRCLCGDPVHRDGKCRGCIRIMEDVETITCVECGIEVVRASGPQKRCRECADEKAKARRLAYSRRKYAEAKAKGYCPRCRKTPAVRSHCEKCLDYLRRR